MKSGFIAPPLPPGHMAPSSAERPEYSTVTFSSCLLQWSLASIVPVLLTVLLLLLCIPFKRKNRSFSIRPIERHVNSSKLIRVTQLGDQSASSPAGKQPKAGTTVQEGSSLPSDPGAPAQRQINGFTGNSHPQPGGSSHTKDLDSSPANHRGERESRAAALGVLGSSSPTASQKNSTAPECLQLRELPAAPRNVQVMTAEQPSSSQDAYGPIYESIRDKGITCCRGSLYELSAGTAEGPNMNSGRVTAGGEESEPGETLPRRTSKQEQLVGDGSSGDPRESPQEWQELALEEDAVNESLTEREKKLRAMYARVCKKSRSSGHTPPASPDASTEPEEEEPPPLPEKHLDEIYETLGSETQDSEVPTVIAQPEE
ncbi:uncharacterized protein LOC117875429 isoform X1 [Trachemys scripta elegans]|uniref:uncharacterized protein LOC117875429 isoform X1 n=2 Tax=Trachemys scripta elegans TaxID=31138 RepID=UPI0015526EE2|nr:uncharacterized protein LOC117875429 isoform X1 [Trachemys scripta elegans]